MGFGIVTRMLAWGAASGAVLGALFPFLAVLLIQVLKMSFGTDAGTANWTMLNVWMGVGCVAGLALGGIAGSVLGLFMGLVLTAFTYKVVKPVSDIHRYSVAVQLVCIVVGGAAALLVDLISGLPRWGANGWGAEWSWLVWGVAPAVVATLAIWWAGRHVANWAATIAPKSG
jgi:hypothetical protein